MVEHDRPFLKDIYVDKDQSISAEDREEIKKNSIKKIKKRIDIFKGREIGRELYRLDQPVANNEQAIAYRAKKKQRERSKNAKKGGDNKQDESMVNIHHFNEHVLPREKIVLAQECRKLYAYCTVGNYRVVGLLFEML